MNKLNKEYIILIPPKSHSNPNCDYVCNVTANYYHADIQQIPTPIQLEKQTEYTFYVACEIKNSIKECINKINEFFKNQESFEKTQDVSYPLDHIEWQFKSISNNS